MGPRQTAGYTAAALPAAVGANLGCCGRPQLLWLARRVSSARMPLSGVRSPLQRRSREAVVRRPSAKTRPQLEVEGRPQVVASPNGVQTGPGLL